MHDAAGLAGTAAVGVSDHCGWAILVAVGPDHRVIDRRRVELVDQELPALPHHHEGQRLPIHDALDLVASVEKSASAHATTALAALAASIPVPISAIALRECPELPPTVEERIKDYWAQTRADGVMYRQALARAAEARGWKVYWYNRSRVEPLITRTGVPPGRPWQKDHQIAMAAAIAARSNIGESEIPA